MTATPSSATSIAEEQLAGNYFVAVYPPFSAWEPEQIPDLDLALQQPPSPTSLGLYLHVPFCQKKCDYCYYLSYVDKRAASVNRDLEAMVEELSGYASLPGVQGRRVSFVYFGGGTPSTLSESQFRLLADGFLTCSEDEVGLTRDGLLRADWLLSRFFDPQYRRVRYT